MEGRKRTKRKRERKYILLFCREQLGTCKSYSMASMTASSLQRPQITRSFSHSLALQFFFIHPITNAGAYLLDCQGPSFTIFHIMWNYSFQSVQIFLVFHLQPYYLKFTVDFTPYSISNLSFWNVFIPPDFHNAEFIT